MILFSERYKDKIDYGHGQAVDRICDDVTYEVKCKLSDVLQHFDEPIVIHPHRYDNYEIRTDAFHEAIKNFNKIMGAEIITTKFNIFDDHYNPLSSSFTPYLFDIIELQYNELTENERLAFQQSIDEVFQDNDLPWVLHDGRMVKIDSCQFEMDLKNKALSLMKELKDAEPVFQSAYTELKQSVEALEKNDFQSAINNAGKSYESVLKVIVGNDKGNADALINQYMNYLTVPDTMTKEGFKGNVMKSLPFIRNNSGADHGAGSKTVVISKPMAKLAVNLACVLDTYLIEEYKVNYGENK